MVFLGAGFDCRALFLDGLKDGQVKVFEEEGKKLAEEFSRRGYTDARIIPLSEITENCYRRVVADEFPASWWMVEATV